jgi:ABC-2 type transport system permease protein
MNAIARVFRYELRRQSRRPGYILASVGVPVVALLLFFGLRLYQQSRQGADLGQALNSGKDSPLSQARPSGVVDKSGLLRKPPFTDLLFFNTEDEAQAALRDNKVGAYYVVAPDYLKSGQIDMYFDRFNLGNINSSSLRLLILQSLMGASGQNIDSQVVARLQEKQPQITIHTVNETGTKQAAGEGASFALVYLFAMMLLFSAFTTSGYLMQSVVEEKESRMVEVILSSVRPAQLLAGKILALGTLGLLQMVLWGAAAVYILHQLIPTTPSMLGLNVTAGQLVVLFIYFVLGYLLFASAYASIGALSNSMREGPQIAAFVTLPAVIPMWATAIFASAPDGPLAVALSIFPITAPLAMVMRIAVTEVPLTQLAVSIVLLMLTVMFTMWLSGRLFRVNTLLSGRLPSLRDLPRLVRGGA